MKKLGCAKCGGTKKMKLGGSAVAKAPVNIFGIPQENMGTSSQMGFGKKGGTVKKEHVLTTFRKANEARNEKVMKSLPKAKDGVSTSTLATELYGTKKETIGNNVNTYRVLDNKGRTIGVRPSSKIAARGPNPGRDPNVGFTYNKPLPKTKYEDAIINTKSSSTKTAGKPVSGYTPKRGATTSVKKTVGPRPSVDEMREANIKKYSALKSKIAEDKKPKPRSTASAIKAGMAGSAGYAIANMFKKNGGTVKSKKKK